MAYQIFWCVMSVPIFIGIGGLGIHALDRDKNELKRPILASLYLAVSSLTTVGYSDDHFTTFQGRLFAIVRPFLGTSIASKSISFLFSELKVWRK